MGTAYVEIKSDTSTFEGDAEKGILGKVGGIATKAAGIFAAGFAVKQGFDFLGGLIGDAQESVRVMAETEQAIKATGGAAGVTAKDVASLAEAMSKKTGIDDEAIQSAENLLLTFKNVRNETGAGNDVFNQATAAVLDLSKQFGGTEASAVQVGKALNDPIAGVTALTRVGIQFTDQQKESIKALVETGDVLGAQKIILGEIAGQVGGQAEAQATAADRARVAWGNFREELGERLLPIVETVATFLTTALPVALGVISTVVSGIGTVLGPVFAAIGVGIGLLAEAFSNPIFQAFATLVAVSLLPSLIAMGVQAGLTAVAVVASYVVFAAQAVVAGATVLAQNLLMIGSWIAHAVAATANAIIIAAAWLIALGPIALLVAAVVAAAIVIIKNWDSIKEFIGNAIDAVVGFLSNLIGRLADFVSEWGFLLLGPIGAIIHFREEIWGVVRAVIGFFGDLVTGVWDKLNEVVAFVDSIPQRILNAIGDLGRLLYNAGRAIINGLKDGIIDGLEAVYNIARGIAGKIASLKGPLDKDKRLLIPAGHAIMEGLQAGLDAKRAALEAQLREITGSIANVGAAGANAAIGGAASGAALSSQITSLTAAIMALAAAGASAGTRNLNVSGDPYAAAAAVDRLNWGAGR